MYMSVLKDLTSVEVGAFHKPEDGFVVTIHPVLGLETTNMTVLRT